jgi:hypothetical protein
MRQAIGNVIFNSVVVHVTINFLFFSYEELTVKMPYNKLIDTRKFILALYQCANSCIFISLIDQNIDFKNQYDNKFSLIVCYIDSKKFKI